MIDTPADTDTGPLQINDGRAITLLPRPGNLNANPVVGGSGPGTAAFDLSTGVLVAEFGSLRVQALVPLLSTSAPDVGRDGAISVPRRSRVTMSVIASAWNGPTTYM
jgi:hypothetical protein